MLETSQLPDIVSGFPPKNEKRGTVSGFPPKKKHKAIVRGPFRNSYQDKAWLKPLEKVPALLRRENGDDNYNPMVVSLGPYHHGKLELQVAENFKHKALELFVADSGKDVQFFHNMVLSLVSFCKDFYSPEYVSAYDDHTFAQIMLLDSCFIIIYILSTFGSNQEFGAITENYLGTWYYGNVIRDIYLLENQVPFKLLKVLMQSRFNAEGVKLLYSFLFKGKIEADKWDDYLAKHEDRPFHILDGIWLADNHSLMFDSEEKRCHFPCYELGYLQHIRNTTSSYVHKCFNFIISKMNQEKKDFIVEMLSIDMGWSVRSATEMKAKGIHCQPSSRWSTKSINFKSRKLIFSTLEVPVRYVNMNTDSFLKNMIAYELICLRNVGRPIAAYVDIMKSLINNPADVQELRERNILITTTGTDEEIVKLFNNIKTYDDIRINIHWEVKQAIQEHYNSKTKMCLADFYHKYFRNPWSGIALLSSTILLILTFMQTYYTIFQSSDEKKKCA